LLVWNLGRRAAPAAVSSGPPGTSASLRPARRPPSLAPGRICPAHALCRWSVV